MESIVGAKLQDTGLWRPSKLAVFLALVVFATAVAVTSAGTVYAVETELVDCDCGLFQEVFAFVETGSGLQRKWTVLDNGHLHGQMEGYCPWFECHWVYTSGDPPLWRQIDRLGAFSATYVDIWYWDCYF